MKFTRILKALEWPGAVTVSIFYKLLSVPIGIVVGCVVWVIIYTQIFKSLDLLPLSSLALKLSPGVLVGAVLGFKFPSFFLWFMDLESTDVSTELDLKQDDIESISQERGSADGGDNKMG